MRFTSILGALTFSAAAQDAFCPLSVNQDLTALPWVSGKRKEPLAPGERVRLDLATPWYELVRR